MLLKFSEFRRRIDQDIESLVADLQSLTSRYGFEEAQSWRVSLPKVAKAFSDGGS